MITEIYIENIRGFQSKNIKLNLWPNKVSVVVAPNGFGKSSISTAFKCAEGKKLLVEEDDIHHKDSSLIPKLRIKQNDTWLEANPTQNEISNWARVVVIKSSIEPKAKVPRINGIVFPRPYLEISRIDLGPAVPKVDLKYDHAACKTALGPNGKIAANIKKICSPGSFRNLLFNEIRLIDRMDQVRVANLFGRVELAIRTEVGTATEIESAIENSFRTEIEQNADLLKILNLLSHEMQGTSWTKRLLVCMGLRAQLTNDRANLKQWLRYGDYAEQLKGTREFMAAVNGSWLTASVKESKGRVWVEFPDARSLSNGQRDILFFAASLLKVRQSDTRKPTILIVDEVFDYLDDGNLAVAQYFLSNIVQTQKREGKEIYTVILTHLDPKFFKSFSLSNQKVNYLGIADACVSTLMKKLIRHREDPAWKDELAKYFLHYHPENCDIREVFNTNFQLQKKYGQSREFYSFLRQEWDKLQSGGADFDPFAVCTFIRVEIEKLIYHKLTNEEQQVEFINTKGTLNKINYGDSIGIAVPEVCRLLGVVYNEALHNPEPSQSSAVALKLRNIPLQDMMRKAISW